MEASLVPEVWIGALISFRVSFFAAVMISLRRIRGSDVRVKLNKLNMYVCMYIVRARMYELVF